MENKYPENIMRRFRLQADLEGDDTSKDEEFSQYTSNEAFSEVLEWEGFIGYDLKIKKWIKDIYGVDLDNISK